MMKQIIVSIIFLLCATNISADTLYDPNTLYHVTRNDESCSSHSDTYTYELNMSVEGAVLTWGYCKVEWGTNRNSIFWNYKDGAVYKNATSSTDCCYKCCFDQDTIMYLSRSGTTLTDLCCNRPFFPFSAYCYIYACHSQQYDQYDKQIIYGYHTSAACSNMVISIYNYLNPNSACITLSGDLNETANEEVNLYVNISETEYLIGTSTYKWGVSTYYPSEYCFDVISGMNYRLHSSETGDSYPSADNPINSTFYLYDDCGNLLQNPTTTIFRNMTDQIYQGNDNPITIDGPGNYNRYDKLSVIIDTHDMAVEKTVYADDEFNTFNLYHNNVGWNLQTIVYDNFTKNAIDMVKVSTNQTCRIGGYDTYTHGFTNENGVVTTYQLSNQNFTIECEHGDYHDYFGNFVANFDAQKGTYMVEIYLDNTSSEYEDGNETLPETPCSTAWSNNDNLIIHEINDTEDARLHYMAGSATTLIYLERWSDAANMWLMVGSSDTLTPYEQGYIQYTPTNWTEGETTMYRGHLWSLNCYCDDTSTLKVWNSTDVNETVFENLTANVRFLNKMSGSEVNPASPIQIRAYAASNNTTLLTIDLKLYNESSLVETESLSLFDWYIDGSFEPYTWHPSYTYTDGYNYTVKMLGLGNALIDIDTVYANSSSPFFNNYELTVFVLDNYNHQVTHSTVFVEGWGSISTGDKYYVSIAGFPQGTYQYKATKAGYISSGWASIELDDHESVNCVLVSETQTSITASKMTNAEIKAFFIPLMYLMLIMMLLGAFKFACGGK